MYLIIGASGFIGSHLYEQCRGNGIDVLGTYCTYSYNPEWVRFDICADDLNEFCIRHLNGKDLDAVVLCGANGNIDSCKKNGVESSLLNVTGTQRILGQADALGAKCVFLSSEAVFDGKKGMYTEEDATNPVTVYGMQKLKVEQYMIHNIRDYLIFRISRAVGSRFGERDIFDEFYKKMTGNKEIVCLKDQSFCLTEVGDIVKGILQTLEQKMSGLYHLSSANYISRYELARFYGAKMFGGYNKISEQEYSEMNFLDNRHIYGGLSGGKLEKLIGIKYLSITDIMENYLESAEASGVNLR